MPHNQLALLGWASFTLSGVLFLVSAIRAGDIWAIVASVIWLAGIGFFVAGHRTG